MLEISKLKQPQKPEVIERCACSSRTIPSTLYAADAAPALSGGNGNGAAGEHHRPRIRQAVQQLPPPSAYSATAYCSNADMRISGIVKPFGKNAWMSWCRKYRQLLRQERCTKYPGGRTGDFAGSAGVFELNWKRLKPKTLPKQPHVHQPANLHQRPSTCLRLVFNWLPIATGNW